MSFGTVLTFSETTSETQSITITRSIMITASIMMTVTTSTQHSASTSTYSSTLGMSRGKKSSTKRSTLHISSTISASAQSINSQYITPSSISSVINSVPAIFLSSTVPRMSSENPKMLYPPLSRIYFS